MSWILDILLVAIVLGTICFYWRRGFVKALFSFGRTLISLVLAWVFGPKLGAALVERLIGNKITQKIYHMLSSFFDSAAETINLSQLFEQAPESFVKTVERFGGDMAKLEAKYGSMTEATHETLMELSQSIAAPIMALIGNLLGFVIVFILAFLFFLLFSGILAKIFELPVLKQINHLLGLLLGILIAALYAVLFCFIMSHLLRFVGSSSGKFVAEELISSTHLFRLIANIKFIK